jgi:hypothetical protein
MMRAISLDEPWASLMAHDLKRIETRGRPTNVRGELAIHATLRPPDFEVINRLQSITGLNELNPIKYAVTWGCGEILCVLNLFDCQPVEEIEKDFNDLIGDGIAAYWEKEFGNYGPGRFGWLTKDVKKLLKPVRCKGKQGFFFLPSEVETAVRAQV